METMSHDLDATDAACFAELRKVLEKHGKLDRFGVTLIHRHFHLDEDECFIESVDVDERVLTVRPIRKDSLPTAVQTQWSLANRDPLQWCEQYCHYSGGTHHSGHQPHIRQDEQPN
jgi:hypothetical protein